MKQYALLFQRIFSIALIVGLGVILALVGIVFLWYLLIFAVFLFIGRKIYCFFKQDKTTRTRGDARSSFEPGHVEVGDFSRGPGRIIEHNDEPSLK